MLTPVPMVRVEMVILDRDLVGLSERIGNMALLHPVDILQLGAWAAPLDWLEMDHLAARYAAAVPRLDRVVEYLRLPGRDVDIQPRISPREILQDTERVLEQLAPEIRKLEDRTRDLERHLLKLNVLQAQLEMLSGFNIDLSELRNWRFLYMVPGLMPPENVGRLDDSLREIPHVLIPLRKVGERVLVVAFSRSQEAEVLSRALDSTYVERIEIHSELNGTPTDAIVRLLTQQAELERRVEEVERDRVSLGDRWGDALRRVRAEAEANARVANAWQKTGRTERTRLLAGWVPRSTAGGFVAQVAAATAGRSLTAVIQPSPSDKASADTVPTDLANPRALRPFEVLTRTYGLPGYWELDPTPLAALLYLLMFGMMFGDLGQGAVLVALGLVLAAGRVLGDQRDFGRILAACGGSAMVFGVLYGSVFGSEEIVPAFWLQPGREPLTLIGVAIVSGMLVLSVGMLFGAVTAWRRRDLLDFYLGDNGLAALWLYLGLVAVSLPAIIGHSLPLAADFLLVGVPLMLFLLRGPIAHAFGWMTIPGGVAYAIESGVEAFDLVVRFVSNTVSFLRLGAFALAHASLGITVFALAGLVQGLPGAYLGVVILGNVLIIALETLVVGIQALRLEYYEFFTKFLRAEGVPYRPFALHRRAMACG
jgi:V/A-type H+/Na+-transporting ATPase subunit I